MNFKKLVSLVLALSFLFTGQAFADSRVALYSESPSGGSVVVETDKNQSMLFKICSDIKGMQNCKALINYGISAEDIPMFMEELRASLNRSLEHFDLEHNLLYRNILFGVVMGGLGLVLARMTMPTIRSTHPFTWIFLAFAGVGFYIGWKSYQEYKKSGSDIASLKTLVKFYAGKNFPSETLDAIEQNIWKIFVESLQEALQNFVNRKYLS